MEPVSEACFSQTVVSQDRKPSRQVGAPRITLRTYRRRMQAKIQIATSASRSARMVSLVASCHVGTHSIGPVSSTGSRITTVAQSAGSSSTKDGHRISSKITRIRVKDYHIQACHSSSDLAS